MSNAHINLCLVIHNHQPIGNFDGVMEQAFIDSYVPFLDVFEPFENLKLTLHLSGPLALWLNENHGEYLDRISRLVEERRIEVIGGPKYEPILAMLPTRDRMGQIQSYTEWLSRRLQAQVRGMWVPERVWESSMTADLSRSGVAYTVLDDFHFQNAGLPSEELYGYYITEDQGRMLRVFPGSERLRYLIPFAEPHETINYLREKSEQYPGAVFTFGDDGEKFGTWPDTKEHVYGNGWLQRFFEALNENSEWLKTCTLEEAVNSTPPIGKVFFPDSSYREMTEWSYPVSRQQEFHDMEHRLAGHSEWPSIRSFISGGFWRNFKIKYTETSEMYSRMMFISNWLEQATQEGRSGQWIDAARDYLYRGQCNCAYWHGAFGGVYLPHLRNAIYENLIEAEKCIDQTYGRTGAWAEASADDFNFDGYPEIRLANDQMVAWFTPSRGGWLYELDSKSICQNFLATMRRRPEVYHDKITAGQQEHSEGDAASIHDRVVFKQDNLDQFLHYDQRPRKSLIDHFWDEDVDPVAVANGEAMERGDFADGVYHGKIRRKENRIQVHLTRSGNVWGIPLQLTKAVTLNAGSDELDIVYVIEGIPEDRVFHFGIEFNFAAMPADHDDRQFLDSSDKPLGHLGTRLDLQAATQLSLHDEWLRIAARLKWDQPSGLWTFPIASVSQSEAGFELIHQSTVVQPHWKIQGDQDGKWSTRMTLKLDCADNFRPARTNEIEMIESP